MRKSKIKQISLAVCLAFIPLYGFAAGLGKLNINSGLGEPLSAEVELLSATPEELATLEARIAPEAAYDVQGITRLGIHNNIKVELAKNSNGAPVLKLHSNQPVSDPYLDVLIQVDWATGRLMREYTVLLDPPGYKASINKVSSTLVSAPIVASPPPVKASVSQQAAKKSSISNTQNSSRSVATNEPTEGEQLMTVRGDTLSSIAKEMQIEGVSLDQMLVGLFENNKEAFFNGNMNRLKVGQIIKAPSKETLITVSPQQAKQAIKVHSANWNEYRNSLAGAVDKTPAAEEGGQKQSASGKIATAEDLATPIKSAPKDVVKLSAGAKDGEKNTQDFDAKILALQEEATAREKTLKESQERMAVLEKQIEDMQKLLALKNQAMTELQQNAEAVSTPATPVPETPSAPVQAAKPAPAVVPPVAEVMPEREPTFMDNLPEGVDITMLGGAAGVALLGAGWMFLRNKRRKDLDSFERGILTSGGLRANTVFGNTTGSASTSDTSFLTDFAQSADGSMIDTHDVDPIAEAEVYMAYGRDAQAEEILKDAISKEPKRYELHLKLLEMYAGRKDVSAFEAIAGELYTTLGADDPTWVKVAELGITVEPDNPLYDVSNVSSLDVAATSELDATDFDSVVVSTDEGLDFTLDGDLTDSSQPEVDEANSAVLESFSAASVENIESDNSFDMGSIDEEPLADASLTANTEVADDLSAESFFEEDTKPEASVEEVEQAVGELVVESNVQEQEVVSDNSLDFDLTEFNLPESKVADVALNESITDLPDLDLPSLDLTETDDDVAAVAELDLPVVDEPSASAQTETVLNLDFSNDEVNVAESEEISFDLPDIEDSASSEAEVELSASNSDANAFDFSEISLDLGDDDASVVSDDVVADLSAESLVDSEASENQDVDIKLDLVAAYIDMDDKEGARELLDEVIKEGGPKQKLRAEQLLASLA